MNGSLVRLIVFASLVCSLYGSLTAESNAQKAVRDIPESVQLLPVIQENVSAPIPAKLRDKVAWPSAGVVESQRARSNRSHTIPPVYPASGVIDPKPVRLGAVSPEVACKEAESWIHRVLKDEWIPSDLTKRLIALQRDPASQSTIVCRYEINGHAVQVSQTRNAMWVIVKPAEDSVLRAKEEQIGPSVFKTFFANGDQMAALKAKETNGVATVHIYQPDDTIPIPPSAIQNWWGWQVWYTDGDAVAVLLRKCTQDSARIVTADDPWF